MPGADKQQRWPGALNGIFIEKFDAAQSDRVGAAGLFCDVFAVQEVISQFLFGNLAGAFAVMFAQLTNRINIECLSTIAVTFEL